MRVLLTGATGFLGSHVLPLLDGHEVLCLSRAPHRVPRRSGVTATAADLGRPGEWSDAVAEFAPDWCLHFAWEGLPDYSLDRCRVNLDSSVRLLDAVASAGVTRVVVAGSCWEYGRASGAVAEHAPPAGVGVFAATKQALLTILDSVARERGFEYAWARVFFVYGPGQRPTSLIPTLGAAYSTSRVPDIRRPDAVQDFVHIDDVAEGLVALAASNAPSGVFNLGSGTGVPVADVANRAAAHYGRRPPFTDVAAGEGFWADMTKTTAATGWRPRIGIDEGLRRTLAALDVAV